MLFMAPPYVNAQSIRHAGIGELENQGDFENQYLTDFKSCHNNLCSFRMSKIQRFK